VRLLVIFGPPAVGKMTVGRAVAARGGFRLFHNHAVLEPLLEVFDYGTAPFMRLLGHWRRGLIEEAAAAGIDLVMTYVWGLELESDVRELSDYIRPYVEQGATVSFIELYADLDTRLERNRTEHRLAEKRSKRDLAWSDGNVRDLEKHVMNTGRPGQAGMLTPAELLLARHMHRKLDNTSLSPEDAAESILDWLDG
jgi:AAA domain